ncbi:MBG domain-containing protein [Bradyrhizobium sp. AZCC 1693]|uniref:MBG domain-containing protein n=1 Tax=Bradyrhizobium sp. AZCC 1693 TaxID=3117029 RepID=UPI002FF2C937
MAQSLPTGGTVVSGSVAIGSTSPTGLTVTQSSATGIVNWSSFSVGQGHQVQFNNGSGATLNRVTGNVPSSINGVLSATGSVYLVNPSGVVVGPTGVIKTGGSFVASTLDVKDAEFRAGGSLTFSGNSNASVVNLGKIGSSKGDVVLIARQVRNDGSLTARNGTAAMASGSEVVLSDGSLGNGKVLVRRPAQDGEIRNSGAIRAAEVELRANGGNIYALAGNAGRAITATGVASKGGRIFLTAEGGSVNVTQKVVARRIQADVAPAPMRAGVSGRRSFTGGDVVVSGDKVVVGGTIEAKGNGGAGGTIVVTGTDVTLTSGATLDASGTSGGTVLIGGDRAGGSDAALKFLPQTIANAQSTTIEAGATITADGASGAGGNVVVWSDGTTSFGGTISATGLRGGFIETSGHTFDFAGGSVNAGPGGTWLLDPVDLTINSTLAGTIATALNGGSDVTQQTSASGTGGNGDITVASGINWSTSATLTLSAYRNIAVNANITSTGGGGVVLRADNVGTGTGTVTFGGGQVSTAGTVSIFYNPTGSSSTVNTTKYTAPTQTTFSGNVTGGATLKTYMLVNTIYDLQNMNNNKAGTYALSRDIDAGVTSTWNSGAGFQQIGAGNSFTGNLDGQGHTISGLFINRPSDQNVGLISYLAAGGTVSNVGVIGATITGGTSVGAIVGNNYGTVSNVYSSGSVTAISAGAGGLVGYNFQILSNGYSNSSVSGPLYVGGAVGLNNIAAGPTAGSMSQVHATGAVTGTGGSPSAVGGLVGYNGNSITQSYWDSYTTGQASGVGSGGSAGVTAVTSDPAQSAAANYAFKQSAYSSFSFPGTGTTGWFMVDGQTRPFGRWEYQTTITNAHQLQLMAMNLGASYTLAGNIDLGSSLTAVGGKYPGMWSSAGFVPIGSTATKFTGAFNGLGHTIANLTINRLTTDDVGLFGYVGTGVTVQDVGLLGAAVTGRNEVGALAGNNAGTITRSYATGVVNGTGNDVGGLVGKNVGTGSNITQSYASVTVGTPNFYVGGLVGYNDGAITQAYAVGAVNGKAAGGLAGNNSGTITQAYAAGAVSGSTLGGLVGNNGGTITQSYFDTVTTGQNAAIGNGSVNGGIGLTTSQMQNPANYATTYAGWDFALVWSAPSVGYYPQLYGVNYVLRVDPANASRVYGDANPALTYTVYGLHTGDTSAILSGLSLSTAATTTSNVGSYAITAGGSVISAAGQAYRLIQTPAALTVTPRAITVTADAKSRTYGDTNPALTYQVGGSGLVNGDTLSGALATSATTASNVGTYGITQGTLAASSNYTLSSFTGANLTVTRRAITVTADAKSRAYGDANPALTYQVGGSGLVNGDTLWGALATSATTASNVGTYGITQGTLAASSNYTLSSFTGANLTVTQRAITVTADAKSRAYGDANPALTYQVGGAGLANGETLSGALATSATTASNVGIYGIGQGTLAASGNYALNYTSNNLTVTQRAITVTADAKSRAYGDANPALTYQVGGSGLVNGDTLSGALATSATISSNVGLYGITQGSLAASGNYALNYTSSNLTVTQRAITVTADAKSRAYGDANPALTYQVGGAGLANGDTLSGALVTSATAASNVGTYGITQGSLAASGNYALNYASNNLTVTQRAITVTADAKSRAYGDANPALTYQVGGAGLANGDTLSGALATSATTASNVGLYGITQGSLAASGNYALNYTSSNLTVTQRAITVTADAKSRAYGDANPALTYQVGDAGLANGDTLSGALVTSATAASNVGTYGIGQGTLAASGNYALNYASSNLTVTQRAITVTADAKSRAYGDANPALTYQVGGAGLANGDTLSGALATSATAASNVGLYGITQGSLAASGNYALNYTSSNLTVTQRAITVTADAKSRAYGDANPALTYQVGGSGLVNGDTLSGALATSATTASNVGTYGITQGTLAASSNYTLSSFTGANLTVTRRAITVTADAKSRAYGDANPALTYQVGGAGLVNGDTLSGALATSATTASNVGTYGITQGSLAASGNYALNYTSNNLTVTQRAITVTADAKSRAYGDANPALTYQVGGSGLVNGDTLSGALATSATTASDAGTYGITQGSLAASGNYALNYTSNNLTVTQRAITVTADAKSRTYGDTNPALTYQVGGSGLVNGDTLSGALATSATTASNVGTYGIGQGTLAASGNYALNYTSNNLTVTQRALTVTADAKSRAYGDANPALTYQVGGAGLVNGDTLLGALATLATTASNVGTYGITQGSLAASGNYALNYASNDLTVTQRAITVTADAKSRAYGDANPALTYQVGGSGLVNGDTLSGALATSATTSSNVGTYGITQGSLAASGNYALNYTSNNLTVTQRALTVTADAKSRAYGDTNPALTYQVGGSGLVNGDTLSGALAASATAASNVGVYGIGEGTLAASANYALNYASANLTVTQRAITVTADAKSRAYGDANPALTYQVGGSGLVNGDTLSGALATSATTASDAGTYGITQGTLGASSNYAFAFVGASLTITPAAAPRVPTAELGAYVKSRVALPAPQPPEQMREPVSIEQSAAAIICKSRQCLELPHPDNRRIGERARFVDTMINRNRLPAFVDN